MAADPNRLVRALVYAVFGFLVTLGMGVVFRVDLGIALLQSAAVALSMVLVTFLLATAKL
ncbi:hypothetical protein [Haloarchaeobius sp. HME9146]|uniref:hypothetical protein n=1 Tax=Haloarchaeobius sp. HME9146 TaxID=2978732 RepID=UPI0021C08B5B|nr:hypothetical protein [Haloarchaeobius sp. HME9146]MCT9095547.1 hypothetical protein [Haloarchaeobius sp. HME9146]